METRSATAMEMRFTAVAAIGRLVGSPVKLADGTVHFRLQAAPEGPPLHCFCEGRTAENMVRYRREGDEITVEGKLEFCQFRDEPRPVLLVKVRFASYGRKKQSLA